MKKFYTFLFITLQIFMLFAQTVFADILDDFLAGKLQANKHTGYTNYDSPAAAYKPIHGGYPSIFSAAKEPNTIPNKAKKSSYVKYDDMRKLWFGIELVTPENIEWWKKRIVYESWLYYGGHLDPEWSEFFQNYVHEIKENKEFMSRVKPFKKNVNEENNYNSAWAGFLHNLLCFSSEPDKYGLTWVAYVSSKEPTKGQLQKEFGVDSADIKMAMTVKISLNFYSPLGIYKSPIAIQQDGQEKYQKLSMLFHSQIACLVREINPQVKYMVLRPITSMEDILKRCKIPFTGPVASFKINESDVKLPPHIRYQKNPESLTEDEKEHIGDGKYVLFDPNAYIFYQLDKNHWFVANKYYGGGDDTRTIEGALTIKLQDLLDYQY